jgi:hypothetical protein
MSRRRAKSKHVLLVGKRKSFLNLVTDEVRIRKHVEEFLQMVADFGRDPTPQAGVSRCPADADALASSGLTRPASRFSGSALVVARARVPDRSARNHRRRGSAELVTFCDDRRRASSAVPSPLAQRTNVSRQTLVS